MSNEEFKDTLRQLAVGALVAIGAGGLLVLFIYCLTRVL